MEALNATDRLSSYRQTIDNIDAVIVHSLAERFRCTEDVGILKARYGLPPTDKAREARQHDRLARIASDAKIDPQLVKEVMDFIISKVVQRHQQIAEGQGADTENS